jgi:hypothetical protein
MADRYGRPRWPAGRGRRAECRGPNAAGPITVDGADPRAERPPIAALFQDFVRYPATLRDNITADAPGEPDEQAVTEARYRAGAPGLPLDTSLWREGGAGTDLSGGQWQRVAVARVLYAVRPSTSCSCTWSTRWRRRGRRGRSRSWCHIASPPYGWPT